MSSQIYYSHYNYGYKTDHNYWTPHPEKRRHTRIAISVECGQKKEKPKNTLAKFNLKVTIRSFYITICAVCFLYQTSQLVCLYVSGRTVVENRVERFKYSQLPAVTVCLPSFMDMKRFNEFYMKTSDVPDFQELYKQFLQFEEQSANHWDGGVEGFQKHLYWNFQWRAFKDNMESFSLADILDKVSLDITVIHKIPGQAFNGSGIRIKLPDPQKVHSVVPYGEPRKCITLFSDFDKNFRQIKYELIYVEIQFQHQMNAFPYEKYYNDDLYVTLHSPNMLPDYTRENVFQKLKMGVVNFITYSESKTLLLPPPYETRCKNYDIDDTGAQDLRNDCVMKCMIDGLHNQFGLNCVWTYNNNKLIRRENLFNYSQYPLCNHDHKVYEHNKWTIGDEQFSIESECNDLCPKNCIESFYTYEIEAGKGKAYKEDHGNHFTIHMEHSRFPDQFIEHRPIMSWTTLFSNLGGLIGMWLGLSVMFICDRFINKFIE